MEEKIKEFEALASFAVSNELERYLLNKKLEKIKSLKSCGCLANYEVMYLMAKSIAETVDSFNNYIKLKEIEEKGGVR